MLEPRQRPAATVCGTGTKGARNGHADPAPCGWYSPHGGEIGDVPMAEAQGMVDLVLKEVPLADGSGTGPIQLMWSNAAAGPEAPISRPHARR